MDDFDIRIGENIKTVRKSKGLSQEELAYLSGISSKHISKIERGICEIKLKNMVKICEALEVSLEQLIYGSKEEDHLIRQIGFTKSKQKLLVSQLRETIKLLEEDIDTGAEGME